MVDLETKSTQQQTEHVKRNAGVGPLNNLTVKSPGLKPWARCLSPAKPVSNQGSSWFWCCRTCRPTGPASGGQPLRAPPLPPSLPHGEELRDQPWGGRLQFRDGERLKSISFSLMKRGCLILTSLPGGKAGPAASWRMPDPRGAGLSGRGASPMDSWRGLG